MIYHYSHQLIVSMTTLRLRLLLDLVTLPVFAKLIGDTAVVCCPVWWLAFTPQTSAMWICQSYAPLHQPSSSMQRL